MWVLGTLKWALGTLNWTLGTLNWTLGILIQQSGEELLALLSNFTMLCLTFQFSKKVK